MSTSAFVKKLAANDRPTRVAAFESLQKYLSSKKAKLSLLDLEKLWKGLYYSMWLCDRPKPQERLAENLGSLYSKTIPEAQFCKFLEAFWVIMIKEWHSIDQWRIDKYLLLIRRILRHSLMRLNDMKYPAKFLQQYNEVLEKLPLSGDKSVPVALPYHLCDIYVEEIERVLFQDIQEDGDEIEDDDIEKQQEFLAQKREIVASVPVLTLLEPFTKLSKSALLKTLRQKCKEDVLDDQRLKDWGVFADDKAKTEDGEDEQDEESEDEWKGF